MYSSVFSVGVTFGKPNIGTVVSEVHDVLLHFQLRGIYRAPNKMYFLSSALLELYDTTSHFLPSTCFISALRFLILANSADRIFKPSSRRMFETFVINMYVFQRIQ